ncbi:MAG: quinone-dependent dihydroorotate dehydrogenase [Pseudomonadota bacterium]
MDYYSPIGKLLRSLPAETAHDFAIWSLKKGLVPGQKKFVHNALKSQVFGLEFDNPLGLAAGFDKNAEAIDCLSKQGFGFLEVGTVTPLPQFGNPKPRLFRLEQEQAIINRFGFNGKGGNLFAKNLAKRKNYTIVGANIGKNKDSLDAIHDYSILLEEVYESCDYITVNISSPNTVGLRDLQQKKALADLMSEVEKKRIELANKFFKRKPLLYKIAPDLSDSDKHDIVEVALLNNIDGLIVSNTTISRPDFLQNSNKDEKGGLSGKPLFELSTATLRDVYKISQGKIKLIGVGGIASPQDAYTKIKAGASLLQIYSALIYQGFGLVNRINKGLVEMLEKDGFSNISQAVGSETGL